MASEHACGVSYFVDSAGGRDENAGTSESTPWRSLDKVNSRIWERGDVILFKAGSRWIGRLSPQGSGSPQHPIRIDRYGAGPKPVLEGRGLEGGTVSLRNQECWEISNLEITNDAAEAGDRRGIHIQARSGAGALFRHLVVRDCDIHHVKGIAAEEGDAGKRTGGIYLEVVNEGARRARFDDVRIENCNIYATDNIGIAFNSVLAGPKQPGQEEHPYPGTPDWEARKFTRVTVRGNKIHDIAKNAIIVRFTDETGLIEHNVCWDTARRARSGNTIFSRTCRGTVFQFNEGYLNHAKGRDGSLYDADLQSPGCIFQYSYSHDNSQGLFWQCTDPRDSGIIVRYNISQNDRGIIFCLGYPGSDTRIHDNIVFIGPDRSPTIISERRKLKKQRRYEFLRNMIYNLSPSASYKWFNANRKIEGNVFFGFHPPGEPEDRRKLLGDPMMVAPGTGTVGLKTLGGYRLKPESPYLHLGFNQWNESLSIGSSVTASPAVPPP